MRRTQWFAQVFAKRKNIGACKDEEATAERLWRLDRVQLVSQFDLMDGIKAPFRVAMYEEVASPMDFLFHLNSIFDSLKSIFKHFWDPGASAVAREPGNVFFFAEAILKVIHSLSCILYIEYPGACRWCPVCKSPNPCKGGPQPSVCAQKSMLAGNIRFRHPRSRLVAKFLSLQKHILRPLARRTRARFQAMKTKTRSDFCV